MNFEPTESQIVAGIEIKKFIEKPISEDFDDRVMVLTGKAGTGKTTLLKHALRKLIKEDIKNSIYKEDIYTQSFFQTIPNVMGVAVSHKAKLRLQDSIPNAATFAGYFGIKPEYGEDGVIRFKAKKKKDFEPNPPCLNPNIVVAHDEISMYDMKMLNNIEQLTNRNCKILLIGDYHQLPPILDDANKATDLDSPAFSFFSNIVELKERVRQTEGNPIIDLSDLIADEITGSKNITKIIKFINENDNINDGIGYRKINSNDIIEDYTRTFLENNDSKIICYRNKTINELNFKIRNNLFEHPEKKYVDGDLLYMNSTYVNFDNYEFFNSDDVKIISILEEIEFYGVHCYRAIVKSEPGAYIILVSEQGQNEYNRILREKKHKVEIAESYLKSKFWKEYYDFQNMFANVSYGYAFTAYKIQGSSARNVYVDLQDILSTRISEKRKLQTLYTAITRATHQVIFF